MPIFENLSNAQCRSPVQKAWEHILTKRGKPSDLKALESLFPEHGIFEMWEFSHIHKVVLGILPINLESELKNEQYRGLVNALDFRGRTPLHWAANRGDTSAVEFLLEAGAKTDAEDELRGTPLSLAASSGSVRILKLLILARASIRTMNSQGAQALYYASRHQSDVAPVKLLLDAGAPVDCKNNRAHTPLTGAAITNRERIGAYLLDKGANMHNQGVYGDTPLFEAIIHNSHEFLELLLRRGVKHTGVNNAGSTILHAIAREADIKTIKILAAARLTGLDCEAKDKEGRTPADTLARRVTPPVGVEEAFRTLLSTFK